jgi:hypothetical protein
VRRLNPDSFWPEAGPEHKAVFERWEALLARTPRLRPVLHQMVGRHRLRLQESGAPHLEVERTLWHELSRWLRDFEVLPEFAVSAIAVTLEDETSHEVAAGEAPVITASAPSPEHSLSDLETLVGDPAFALALHCIDARIRPELRDCLAAVPALGNIPEPDWFALLHASARPQATLTAQSAVALVLHVIGERWSLQTATCRQTALRLFVATPAEVRGELDRIAAALPRAWELRAADLAAFVSSAGRLRAAFADASRLCGRFVAAVRERPGGLALLSPAADDFANPAEIAALFRNTRKYGHIGGFRKLLALL